MMTFELKNIETSSLKHFKATIISFKMQQTRYLYIFASRYDADCLLKNIFEIFDTNAPGGRITNNDILWVFSMAMTGTGEGEEMGAMQGDKYHVNIF